MYIWKGIAIGTLFGGLSFAAGNYFYKKWKGRKHEDMIDIMKIMDEKSNEGVIISNFLCIKNEGTGNYLTLDQLERRNRPEIYGMLSLKEEGEVIKSFEEIIGMKYYEALKLAQKKEYHLHPLQITYKYGHKRYNTREKYSRKIISVILKENTNFDKDFFKEEDKYTIPTENAIITSIVDVGGIDIYKRNSK